LRIYEILFIVRPDYDEDQIAAVIEKYTDVIIKDGGTVLSAEKWAKRRLAYEIAGLHEGNYLIIVFEGTPDIVDEIDRLMKIDQEVIRHMISRIDNVPELASKFREVEAAVEESSPERSTGDQEKPEAEFVDEPETEEE